MSQKSQEIQEVNEEVQEIQEVQEVQEVWKKFKEVGLLPDFLEQSLAHKFAKDGTQSLPSTHSHVPSVVLSESPM